MEAYMPYIWLIVAVLAVLAEVATAQLVSIWFVVGAVVALISSLCNANVTVQLVIFIVVTVVSLIATKPLVKKIVNSKKISTNVDRYIGMTAIVTDKIDNEIGKGLVNVAGSIWSARSVDNEVIEIGENVTVTDIQGVKLIVKHI